jgi:hypothetical protein
VIEDTPSDLVMKELQGNLDREKLAKKLTELYVDFDVDITEDDLSTAMRFKKPKPILSRRELLKYTKQLVDEDWCLLRLATVSAEWLTKELQREPIEPTKRGGNCRIQVISNIDTFTDKKVNERVTYAPTDTFHYLQMVRSVSALLKHLKDCTIWDEIEIEWYAFRNLEHHMTIASGKKHFGAIYFRRPGKNTSISPVYLDDPMDIKSLIKYFDGKVEFSRDKKWLTNDNPAGCVFIGRIAMGKLELRKPKKGISHEIDLLVELIQLFVDDDGVEVVEVVSF